MISLFSSFSNLTVRHGHTTVYKPTIPAQFKPYYGSLSYGYTFSYHRTLFWWGVRVKCESTRWRTGGEVKEKLVNWVGSQYSSYYIGTWCIEHYYGTYTHIGCQLVDWTDAPADLNGPVRFAERRNLVFARVPSHFKRSVLKYLIYAMQQYVVWIFRQVVYIVNITTSKFDDFRSCFQISAMHPTIFFLLFFVFWNVFLKRCVMNKSFTMILTLWRLTTSIGVISHR